MTDRPPIRVAILWHMHQPDYREPGSTRLAMPWVRLHALKDYLDMPLRAAAHDRVKVTFNLVPSLLDQLDLYAAGGLDRHLELTLRPADELHEAEKLEILDSFFCAHPQNMIEPYPRFQELFRKHAASLSKRAVLPALFTSEEIRDLQVWSNLVWIDPLFHDEEPVRMLMRKERHFTEDDKRALIDWQLALMKRIVPTYRDLYRQKKLDISFTPYYHPILPLLCDTESAREALPGIGLPKQRFAHPEDADRQIRMAVDRFADLFGEQLTGMWPSEGSVSEEALGLIRKNGIRWAASDEEILYQSLTKSSLDRSAFPLHAVYDHRGLRLFFRDHALSDKIGFVYSGWTTEEAVNDFIGHLHQLRQTYRDRLDRIVVPIILDGENAWEYFPGDGADFLETLYRRLAEDDTIETVTFSEAAETAEPHRLTSVFAGSWINHNFRIWIGHPEDNLAWDLLARTREMLVRISREDTRLDPAVVSQCWNQIYVAEGSDWCWWFGDEHRGLHNREFDKIFRRHLAYVYELLGQPVPMELLHPIHGETVASYTSMPDDILTAQIDGRVTHFYEWAGAGYYDCLKAGGAMHRVERYISGIHFAYDHNRFYIRLDFHDRKGLDLLAEPAIEIACFTPAPRVIRVTTGQHGWVDDRPGECQFALGDILEVGIERNFLWPGSYGPLGFTVSLLDADRRLEVWPENDPIEITVPEKNLEMFWPM
ncbi:glycoside hydrolase [candidate division GN15 bacterium]|nr:glycoside hydrolase [candidate division GN15 bacterium]